MGEANRRGQADEQMHVVGNTADGFRNTSDIPHHTAEISVKAATPCGGDDGRALLGAEHDVEMEG